MLKFRQAILELTKELVQVESVVNTDGEIALANFLHEKLLDDFPYFHKNPSKVIIQPTINDQQERYNVMAFVNGTKGNSNRTVILMSHFDTVDTFDFGHLQDHACSPDTLMELFQQESLPDDVKQQLDSGDWLFGRGALDMKSGLASQLYLLKYFSERTDELDGNIVFIAACDEEDGSHGILSALPILHRWKEAYDFHYVAAINADFVAPDYEQDNNRYVYKGTIGKLLPTFFITGAETHVGSPFEGLDPNYLAAELTKQISYNPALSEQAFGETTVPPVSLKQTDLKPSYTVQTALAAFVYYNFFVYTWTPKEVLQKLKEQAHIAFTNAIEQLQEKYETYYDMMGETAEKLPWQPKVLTYKEMEAVLEKEHGDHFVQHMEQFKQELLQDETLDTRLFSVKVVEEAWSWMTDQSPSIILFYSSLYSPSVVLDEERAESKALMQALDEAVEEVQPHYQHPIVARHFFPHISDMSFMKMGEDEEGIQAVADNNPSWKSKHYVNYDDVRKLNVPVVNIGPYGMDAHKRFERTEMTYSFEIVPKLTKRVVEKLLD